MRTNRTGTPPSKYKAGLAIRGTNNTQWGDFMGWLLVARICLLFNVLDIVTEMFKAAGRIPFIHRSSGSPSMQ